MYQVYVLYSKSFNKYYIGQTNNVTERLKRHNNGYVKSTSNYLPWELIGFIEKETRAEAMKLETKLKNLNKSRIKIFITKYLSN
ncbi:conserved hypothetical protein [uncultured Paludibacter sp.]|nr:conserved hypothetical protein [uncultured Paludibacter sp.]